jgi:hypothetical protein
MFLKLNYYVVGGGGASLHIGFLNISDLVHMMATQINPLL